MTAPGSRRQQLDSMRSVYLVARRELVTRVRSRVFRITTVLIVLLLIGGVELKTRVLTTGTNVTTVGFTGPAQVLAQPLSRAARGLGLEIAIQQVSTQASGESQVRSGRLDVLVRGPALSPHVLVKNQLDTTLQAALSGVVKQEALTAQLVAHGLNPRTVEARVAGAIIHVQSLTPSTPKRTQQLVIGLIVAIILYISLTVYGTQVSQGVAEEKESRIIEILLATVRSGELLAGKVAGIGLVGFLQLAVIGAVGLILIARTHVVTIPALGVEVVAGGLLWFVLGFALYASLFAAVGSLVSRVQDVQLASLPITMVLVVAYVVGAAVVLPDPGSLASTLLSLVPFLAPVLMPERMATGDATAWQVAVAIVLMLVAIGAANWLAARIYSNSVLRTGARVPWQEALSGR
ncbi:MAG TPA: ABC transporter permease [Chloroflexota bacterium]|nr:ABC transporter permease [Chloroflexota bacterium]